jgi:hypothetical protein
MRSLKDAQLIVTKALPAAAANHNTGTIDLESVANWPSTEKVAVQISVPALPALVEAKTVTIKLQDSADNSSYADIEELASLVITGGTGNGAAAVTREVFLPPTTKRYIQANIAVLTAGGDNTGVSLTLALLF